jgi:hypothetical protein
LEGNRENSAIDKKVRHGTWERPPVGTKPVKKAKSAGLSGNDDKARRRREVPP